MYPKKHTHKVCRDTGSAASPPPCVKRAGRRLAKAAAVKQYAGVGAGKIAVRSAYSPQRGFSLILRRAAIGRQIQEFNVSLAFTIMSDRYANSAQVLRHSYPIWLINVIDRNTLHIFSGIILNLFFRSWHRAVPPLPTSRTF